VTPGETRHAYDGYDASKAIIQDCEDALTNWVSSKAVVKSSLSTRSRTLSQRRSAAIKNGGVDLSGQDQPLEGDRDSWLPADQHPNYEDEDEGTLEGEVRGREEEREPIGV
jgi:hypothetical protein